MARRPALMERTARLARALLVLVLVLVLVLGACLGSPSPGRRLVCWKAILKCHGEPDCHYAYEQYIHACAPVLSGGRRGCPSHCISSLIQLNRTQSGPALEDCDCALDPVCGATKRAIEPCLPRTSTLGCTEARRQCEADAPCGAAMGDYLLHCRKLFGGESCSADCRRVIAGMRSMPKARQLDTCVCDGTDRNICEYIKVSMKTFCSDSDSDSGDRDRDRFAGSGFSDAEDDTEADYFEPEEDYRDPDPERSSSRGSSGSTRCHTGLHVLSSILVLRTLI